MYLQRCTSAADADGSPHRAGRLLQELQREAGLGLRVRHRGQPALQGGKGHPREGARQRTGRHRRGQPQGLIIRILTIMCLSPFLEA